MFKKKLDEDEGMLFVFPDEDYRAVWMKNTYIPLDILFIDHMNTITQIITAYPCEEECTIYPSKTKVQYILEINQGAARLRNINVGSRLEME